MLKLQLREVDGPLTTPAAAGSAVLIEAPREEPEIWHDSSLELERGLDVQELSVDLHLCDLPSTPDPEPSESANRR